MLLSSPTRRYSAHEFDPVRTSLATVDKGPAAIAKRFRLRNVSRELQVRLAHSAHKLGRAALTTTSASPAFPAISHFVSPLAFSIDEIMDMPLAPPSPPMLPSPSPPPSRTVQFAASSHIPVALEDEAAASILHQLRSTDESESDFEHAPGVSSPYFVVSKPEDDAVPAIASAYPTPHPSRHATATSMVMAMAIDTSDTRSSSEDVHMAEAASSMIRMSSPPPSDGVSSGAKATQSGAQLQPLSYSPLSPARSPSLPHKAVSPGSPHRSSSVPPDSLSLLVDTASTYSPRLGQQDPSPSPAIHSAPATPTQRPTSFPRLPLIIPASALPFRPPKPTTLPSPIPSFSAGRHHHHHHLIPSPLQQSPAVGGEPASGHLMPPYSHAGDATSLGSTGISPKVQVS
ncbi:hypothetical protein RI367_003011 [Sorochytrium milnesiophthora]